MNPLFTAANIAGSKLGSKLLDPYLGFRFMVEIEGMFAGGFQEVSGLSIEIETENVQEGGVNTYQHRLPKGVKYGDIVLKRGLLDVNMVGGWFHGIAGGEKIERRSGSIRVLNSFGVPTISWDFTDAYPTKWEASGLNSSSNGIVTESVTLVHHGIKKAGIGGGLSSLGGVF